MFPRKVHQIAYFISTLILVIMLPDSIYFLSISMFILAGNWLFEGRFKTKFELLKKRKSLWILLSVYLVHVIWMINTERFSDGMADLRLKLPLVLLPLIYGTIEPFPPRQFKIILQVFTGCIIVNTIIISSILFGLSGEEVIDLREASPFISHIRFSLMVVLAIFVLVYLLVIQRNAVNRLEKLVYPALILWLIGFLVLFQTLTGIVVFIVLVPVTLVWWAQLRQNRLLTIRLVSLILIILAGITIYVIASVNRFYARNEIDLANLDKKTVNGECYDTTELESDRYENGNRVMIYIAHNELRKAWNERSMIDYDNGLDMKGQFVRFTLYRYMSSLGLRKDSAGFSTLTPQEIDMIEKGYTSYIFKKKYSIYNRIYEILWELDEYHKGGDPKGKSLGQRLEYLKTGSNLARRVFWFGTGTGDLKHEFKMQYIRDGSELPEEIQRRAHNQYLTFLISFGIIGALWIIFALIAPAIMEKRHRNYLMFILLLLSLLSMINEDSLETHIGVSFFAFFYVLFLYGQPPESKNTHEKA